MRERERERERERDRQTDRQADRQTQADRDRQRETLHNIYISTLQRVQVNEIKTEKISSNNIFK